MTQPYNDEDDVIIEALLIRSLNGDCSDEERAQVENTPDLRERLAELQRFDDTLGKSLCTFGHLTDEDLVDFVMGTLDAAHALVVERAVQRDPELRAEVAALRAMFADDPFAPEQAPSLLDVLVTGVRQILELTRVQATSVREATRGNALSFEAASIALTLRQEQVQGEDPSWTLRGVVEQDEEGVSAIVILRSVDGTHYRTLADEEGMFRFRGLKDGTYSLTLLLDNAQQEVKLNKLGIPWS